MAGTDTVRLLPSRRPEIDALLRMLTESSQLDPATATDADLPSLDARAFASSEAGKEHLPFADGLRVAALLAVGVAYMALVAPAAFGEPNSFVGRLFGAGSHGIELFFALSGFCLAYPALMVLRCEHGVGF